MKKFYSYILVIFLIFILTGCGNSSNENTTSTGTQETPSTQSTDSDTSAKSGSTATGLAADILGSWSSEGSSGEGTSTTTWTFKNDGSYTLEVSTNAGGESNDDDVISTTQGTYEISGSSLIMRTGSDTDVSEEQNSGTEAQVDDPDLDENTTVYTAAVNGDELTLTTQDGQAEIYTKTQN